jgi:hypothetical protein
MTTKAKELEALEADYQQEKQRIRSDSSLSWEKQELAIKRLGDEYHARRR